MSEKAYRASSAPVLDAVQLGRRRPAFAQRADLLRDAAPVASRRRKKPRSRSRTIRDCITATNGASPSCSGIAGTIATTAVPYVLTPASSLASARHGDA